VLLSDLAQFFIRHAWLPKWGAAVLALWTVAAHGFDNFDLFPRLALTSPTRRCGKTTVVKLLKQLLPRPLVVNSATGPYVFRVIEQAHPSLLFDEGDNYLPHDLDLRAILNSGHERETAWVGRTEAIGDGYEPTEFSTWTPIVLAGIGELPPTLADRSICLLMQRKARNDKTIRFRPRLAEHAATAASLRRRAARFAADSADELANWDGKMNAALYNRIADNWLPLVAVAELAGGQWPQHAELAALADVRAASESEEYGELLLADLVAIFVAFDEKYGNRHDKLPTHQLLSALHRIEERPWPEYGRARKPMSAMQLARLLRPFRIRSVTIRPYDDDETVKGYRRQPIELAYTRYAESPDAAVTPSQPAGKAGDSRESEPSQKPDVTARASTQTPSNSAACDGVTAGNGDFGGGGDMGDDLRWRSRRDDNQPRQPRLRMNNRRTDLH
jgi:putative DNA primase/helicase